MSSYLCDENGGVCSEGQKWALGLVCTSAGLNLGFSMHLESQGVAPFEDAEGEGRECLATSSSRRASLSSLPSLWMSLYPDSRALCLWEIGLPE